MLRYAIHERIFIVETFYESNKSPVTVVRTFAKEFKVHSGPDRKTITRLIKKFEHTGSVCDNMNHNVGRQATASTPENVEKSKVRRATQEIGIKYEVAENYRQRFETLFLQSANAPSLECFGDSPTTQVCQ